MTTEQIIPDESDAFIDEGHSDRYDVSFDGKYLGCRGDMDAALSLVVVEMERTGYYPNVWSVNDHGNTTLLLLTIEDSDRFTWDYSDVAYV